MADPASIPAMAASDAVTLGILGGIGHGLNGRLASLTGILHVARQGGLERELCDMLEGEVARLGELTTLLRLLAEPPRAPEAVLPSDAIREAASLTALQRGLEDMPVMVEPAPREAPVRVQRGALRRLLLLLLLTGSPDALARGGGLRVRITTERGVVVVEVKAEAGPRPRDRTPPPVPADAAEAAAALARAMGGEVLVGEAGRLELRLPALMETVAAGG